MPDHIPPGAPAEGTLNVSFELLNEFANRASDESMTIGKVQELSGIATVEGAVPGAQLINGCIGFRQTVEPLIGDLYDALGQLYLDIQGGLATIRQADETNAADIGQVGGR